VAGGSQNLDARQILVTDVAKGSPADGVLENGDVVTGLKDRAFGVDARILSAQAVTEAEKETNGGVLRLVRWRAGKTENVQSKLPVVGTYAPTAPYGCAKSEHISPAERQSKSLSGYRAPVGSTGIWKILEHEHD